MSYQPIRYKEDFGSPGNLGAALNSTVEFNNEGGFSTAGFRLKIPTGGQVAFEASFDGTNFLSVTLRSINSDEFQQIADADDHFIGSISSVRKFRCRTSVAGSAAGDVVGRATMDVAMLEGQEFLPPPHKFCQTPIHKDSTFTTTQAGTAIWTPASGKRFVVTDCIITANGTTDANVSIFDGTDVPGNRLFYGFLDPSANFSIQIPIHLRVPFISSAPNNALRLTTTAGIDCSVVLHGYEIN